MTRRQPSAALRADDLTAKARIRNAALDLFAANGAEATSLRAVAAAAGVTVGLVVHHYGTKKALREAVELAIVEQFAQTIASVPLGKCPPGQVTAAYQSQPQSSHCGTRLSVVKRVPSQSPTQ